MHNIHYINLHIARKLSFTLEIKVADLLSMTFFIIFNL